MIISIPFSKLNWLILLTSSSDVSLNVFNLHSRYKTKSGVLLERKELDSVLILQENVFYTSRKLNLVNGMHIFLDTLKGTTFCCCFFCVKVVQSSTYFVL